MLYLIDGYNVTKGDPSTRALGLEAQRAALVGRIRARGRDLLGAGSYMVVFDGDGGAGLSGAEAAPVAVRFSRGESADDLLVRLASTSREQVCLVSSDSGVIERARAVADRGFEARSRETLYEAARSTRRGGRRRNAVPRDAGIPAGGNKITSELKELWLDEQG